MFQKRLSNTSFIHTIAVSFSEDDLKQLNSKAGDVPLPIFIREAALSQTKTRISRKRQIASKFFILSSSFCGLVGGSMVASKTSITGYGFVPLALSSSQMLLASLLMRNWFLVCQSSCIFIFVDCIGIVNWLLG